ncbi:glycosyltransferase [Aliivibrio sifiae]|uniref:glycosyltransferase n=1 Tax=Aliivibrio sifiae TaxID=566293 RepID=UPI003D0DD64B
MTNPPFISVIIKTYNEEDGIAKTITSIQQHIGEYPHKIIVADSLSTDTTQTIASEMGVTVVSLTNPQERCCGVGHQLGYLHSEGDFLLLLDGDMELEPSFIKHGVSFLIDNPDYAGVAGVVEMDDVDSYEFKSRKQRINQIYPLGDCSHLGGGGLYRKSAIDEIGYLTNRNLHAYEESELGMRLTLTGYKLHRLDVPYFSHTSYTMSSLALMKHRWKGGYLFASGELLKGSFGTPLFKKALGTIKNEAIFTIYLILLISTLFTLNTTLIISIVLPLLAFIALKTIKNRSIKDALQSVFNLSIFSAGLIRGLFLPLKDPKQPPQHKIINEGKK